MTNPFYIKKWIPKERDISVALPSKKEYFTSSVNEEQLFPQNAQSL